MAEPPLSETDFEYLDTVHKPEPLVDDFFSEMALSAPETATVALPQEAPPALDDHAAENPPFSALDEGEEPPAAARESLASRIKRVLAAWLAKLKPAKSGEGTEQVLSAEAESAAERPHAEPLMPFDEAEEEIRPAFMSRHALALIMLAGVLGSAALAVGVVWIIKHRAEPPRPETVAISRPSAPRAAPAAAAAAKTPAATGAEEAQLAELRAKNAQLEQELKQAQEKNPSPSAAEAPNPEDCIITGNDADYEKTLKSCIKAFNSITGRPPK